MDRSDLITRLEQAEAGSRELDCEMFVSASPHKGGWTRARIPELLAPYVADPTGYPEDQYETCIADSFVGVPRYTTSLDAITALIGEKLPGWVKGYQDDPKGARAILANPQTHYAMWSTAKTPATAFCVSLLRAIKEGEHG